MNLLLQTVEQSGVEKPTAEMLKEKFLPFFEQAEVWKEKAESLVVTDVSQKQEMKDAREGRLALKQLRVNAEKIKTALKADSLAYGRAVQGVYNVICETIAPIEAHLNLQERFAEIQQAKMFLELKALRDAELAPFAQFVPFYVVNSAALSEDDYQKILNGAKLQQEQFDAKIIAQGIERQRLEVENALRIEAEKIAVEQLRVENLKLQAERDAQAKIAAEQLRQEREKAEAERLRVAAEQKAIQDTANAEIERLQNIERERQIEIEKERQYLLDIECERLHAEAKAKNAPDKEKLMLLIERIESIEFPDIQNTEGVKIAENVKLLLGKTTAYIRQQAEKL